MSFVVSLCLIPHVSMQFGRKLTMIECEMILEDYGSKIRDQIESGGGGFLSKGEVRVYIIKTGNK